MRLRAHEFEIKNSIQSPGGVLRLRVPPGGARATQKGVRLRAHEFEIKFSRKGRSRRLGLSPVTRGRSRVVARDIDRRQGALTMPRRLCDRKSQ